MKRLNYAEQSPALMKKLLEMVPPLQQSGLGNTLLDLINIRASTMNGCAFCLDMHVKEAKLHGERELRVYHVAIWRESNLFSAKERAALEWTETVTNLPKTGISEEIYQRTREHFSEKEISDLTFAIGLINFWNRMNVSFLTEPGILDTMFGLDKAGLK